MIVNSKNSNAEAGLPLSLSQEDEFAFEEIYSRHQKRVYSKAYLLLRSHEAAQEIVQEVFMEIWKDRERFSKVRSVGAYIQSMGRNLAVDYIRRQGKVQSAQLEFASSLTQTVDNIDHPIQEEENKTFFKKTLDSLPPRQKEVFVLSRIEGLSNRDIAKRLNISIRTVEDHIQEALRVFRRDLKASSS
jgi:RNA polymerase sigma-70 factor (family 1)